MKPLSPGGKSMAFCFINLKAAGGPQEVTPP